MEGFFAAVVAFFTSLIALVIPGFGGTETPRWNGYVEADYVYVAPLAAGQIATLAVQEGGVRVTMVDRSMLHPARQIDLLSNK